MFTIRVEHPANGKCASREVFACARYEVHQADNGSSMLKMFGVDGIKDDGKEIRITNGDRVYMMNPEGATVDSIRTER